MKSKTSSKPIIIILFILCIILGILCIKFYIEADKSQSNADYTYNLYLQGISDEEKNKYQEWIDSLGTDEYSAYHQGYLDGKNDKPLNDRKVESDISNNEELSIYKKGYSDGLKDGYNEGADNTYSEAYDEGYHDASKKYEKDNKIKYLFVSIVILIILAVVFINPFTKKDTN